MSDCTAGVYAAPALSEEHQRLLRAAGTSLRFLLVVLSDEDASLNLVWSFKSPASARSHSPTVLSLGCGSHCWLVVVSSI